jgi:hypothetical protein
MLLLNMFSLYTVALGAVVIGENCSVHPANVVVVVGRIFVRSQILPPLPSKWGLKIADPKCLMYNASNSNSV